ncbi:MAG: hypothetical protein HY906_08610 [Deltaproteobacteria bacterium]|nr:hypothetical protein [Deltaproteobacteria bacterium]
MNVQARLDTDQDASDPETFGEAGGADNDTDQKRREKAPRFLEPVRRTLPRAVPAGALQNDLLACVAEQEAAASPTVAPRIMSGVPQVPEAISWAPRPPSGYQLLQQWEGVVNEVHGHEFTARLRDVVAPANPEKQATFELEQVHREDLALVQQGAVFYWTVGYRIEPHGQKKLESLIHFQRLPAWTRSELTRARQLAAEFDVFFSDPDR